MRTYHLTFITLAAIALVVFGQSKGTLPKQTNVLNETAVKQGGSPNPSRYTAYVLPALSEALATAIPTAVHSEGGQSGVLEAETPLSQVFRTTSDESMGEIQISSGLIADLKTQQIYWDFDADKQWPLASITKLVTGAFAVIHTSSTQTIQITDEIFSHLGDTGSSGFFIGETYSVQDIVNSMLLFSSNESAEALAVHFGRVEFLSGMNALASSWGVAHTHFEDPTGLSVANQSTAKDIALIAKNIYEHYPALFRITRTPKLAITELGTKKKLVYQNINEFAGRADFIGGKTGYTTEAAGNLVSVFAYEGRPIVIVVLGSEDRFNATQNLLDWFKRTHTSR